MLSGAARDGRAQYLADLLRVLVARDFKLRYKRSVLGIGWTLVNPLLQFAVFYAVFQWVIPVGVPDFAVFLLVGILAWNWFQASLVAGCAVITDNPGLLRQPDFPVPMLPFVAVTTSLVNFVLALPVLALVMAFSGLAVTPALVAIPIVVAVQFLLTLSLTYILAMTHVTFRDTQHLLGVFLLLGFYLSPVFYPVDAVPQTWRPLYLLNPLAHLLQGYRDIVMHGSWPQWAPLSTIAAISAGLLVITYRRFVGATHRFVEEIGG